MTKYVFTIHFTLIYYCVVLVLIINYKITLSLSNIYFFTFFSLSTSYKSVFKNVNCLTKLAKFKTNIRVFRDWWHRAGIHDGCQTGELIICWGGGLEKCIHTHTHAVICMWPSPWRPAIKATVSTGCLKNKQCAETKVLIDREEEKSRPEKHLAARLQW